MKLVCFALPNFMLAQRHSHTASVSLVYSYKSLNGPVQAELESERELRRRRKAGTQMELANMFRVQITHNG